MPALLIVLLSFATSVSAPVAESSPAQVIVPTTSEVGLNENPATESTITSSAPGLRASSMPGPFHVRYHAGATAWRALDLIHFSGLHESEAGLFRADTAWLLDPWFCDVFAAEGTNCLGHRLEFRIGPELELSKKSRLALQFGGFYRWHTNEMQDPFQKSKRISVLREEVGYSLSSSFLWRFRLGDSFGWGMDWMVSILVPSEPAFYNIRYFLPTDAAIIDPRATIFMEFTP